jgi:hypothetical protein
MAKMKTKSTLRRLRILLTLVLGIVLTGSPLAGETSAKHDLSAEIKTFDSYTKDFHAALQSVHGEEFESANYLQELSAKVSERLTSLKYTLKIYDSISCKSDRETVKALVKDQLAMNAYLINSDADTLLGMLAFVKVPATAQMGLKLKDDMRATKERLDSIAASLD